MTYLIAIFIYLLILTGIGIYKSRQVKTQEDFTVAGRTLSPWIMVCTMLAVWIGTGSIVGNAGKTYQIGMSALWLPCGTFIGMILLSFIATRARNIEALTVPEIIGKRFGATARVLAVTALILAYMVIVGYQFNAGGMVLEVIAGQKDKVTLDAGNPLTRRQVRKGYFRYEPPADWTGVAHVGFEAKDKSTGQWSGNPRRFTVLVVPSTEIIAVNEALETARDNGAVTPLAEAWFASSLIPDPENGRYVLIYAARHFMPLALGLLFMITVVGIIISTADSFLLVPATTFIKDIYQAHINPKASEKKIIFMSRFMVLTFGVIAWLISLAFAESTTVFEKALYAFTVYGSAITPCLVAALLWKGATKAGAITSILAGTVTTLLWGEVIKDRLPAQVAELDAVLPAITLSVICLIVVSLFTQKQQPTGGD